MVLGALLQPHMAVAVGDGHERMQHGLRAQVIKLAATKRRKRLVYVSRWASLPLLLQSVSFLCLYQGYL